MVVGTDRCQILSYDFESQTSKEELLGSWVGHYFNVLSYEMLNTLELGTFDKDVGY